MLIRTMARSVRLPLVLLAAPGLAAGCDRGPQPALAMDDRSNERPPVYVDSERPIEDEVLRFREGLLEVTALSGGAATREALVAGFVRALAAHDTSAVRGMLVDRAEFIYLYYPSSKYVDRPYQLQPGLLWFQMQNFTSRGITRAFQRLAGRDLEYVHHRCTDAPEREGANTIWDDCTVHLGIDGEPPQDVVLFGSIIERDGHYKFLSYSNRL
jgi:hypothetical protein